MESCKRFRNGFRSGENEANPASSRDLRRRLYGQPNDKHAAGEANHDRLADNARKSPIQRTGAGNTMITGP